MTNPKSVCIKKKSSLLFICVFNLITESDGSNDSGTSSFGSDNKNNPKSRLSSIPFIEAIKVLNNIYTQIPNNEYV